MYDPRLAPVWLLDTRGRHERLGATAGILTQITLFALFVFSVADDLGFLTDRTSDGDKSHFQLLLMKWL